MKPSLKNIMFEQTPGGGEQACHMIYERNIPSRDNSKHKDPDARR